MVAIFACAEAGLLEVIPLPGLVREQAVLGIRPHIRPLLAALQRCPGSRALDEVLAAPPGASAAIGLPACLAAVNACAVQTLIVPEDGLVPGYECGRCGALSTDADSCPDWGTAALPVPDVIEEMVTRVLEDGAQIWVIRGASLPGRRPAVFLRRGRRGLAPWNRPESNECGALPDRAPHSFVSQDGYLARISFSWGRAGAIRRARAGRRCARR